MTNNFGLEISPTIPDKNKEFSSEYTSYKIFKSSLNKGPIGLTVPAGVNLDITVPHGLGYSPTFLFWFKDIDGYWHFHNGEQFSLNKNGEVVVFPNFIRTDDIDLHGIFPNISGASNVVVAYHYVVLYDKSV